MQNSKSFRENDVKVTTLTCRINKINNTYRLSGPNRHPAGRQKIERALTLIKRALLNKSWNNIQHKRSCTATYHPSQRLSKLDEEDVQYTAEGPRTIS